MPVKKYQWMRSEILSGDTLETKCDSMRIAALKSFSIKDSIIQVQKNKIAIKDSMIAEKNHTISILAKTDKKSPPMVPWLAGGILGLIAGILLSK